MPTQWTWIDGFSSQNTRWSWGYYSGTGYHICPTTIDGYVCVENGITDASSPSEYSDSPLYVIQSFSGTDILIVEGRFRFTDDNGITDSGKGTRGFGFWKLDQSNIAWFWSASPESTEEYRGLRAVVSRDGTVYLNQPISGVDIKEWHIYKIVISSTGTKFWIDGELVAESSYRPNAMDQFMMWIDNYRIPQFNYLNLNIDEKMYIDWVKFYAGQEPAETIVAKEFPMRYLVKPATAQELTSKVEGATVTHTAKDFPEALLKEGKAKELRSKWT